MSRGLNVTMLLVQLNRCDVTLYGQRKSFSSLENHHHVLCTAIDIPLSQDPLGLTSRCDA